MQPGWRSRSSAGESGDPAINRCRQVPDRTAQRGHAAFAEWCPSAARCRALRSQLRSPGGSPEPRVMTEAVAHLTPRNTQPRFHPSICAATQLRTVLLVQGCRLRCRLSSTGRRSRTAPTPGPPSIGVRLFAMEAGVNGVGDHRVSPSSAAPTASGGHAAPSSRHPVGDLKMIVLFMGKAVAFGC